MNNTKIIPHVATSYEVGAILCDSWGYDQTNIDYYCIIARKGEWLTVQAMKKYSNPEAHQSMTTTEVPFGIDYSQKPLRKLLKIFNGEERGFSFRNYSGGGWCSLWNGKAKTASHYA